MRVDAHVAAGAAAVALAVLPPLAPLLEARLATHLLVQYTLLVAGGALIGARLARGSASRWTAAPALLAAAFWLLPRWIDAALADPAVDAAKASSLALLAGLPLGWGWVQAGPVLRGFAWANAAAMLSVMGWLQMAVPSRLCNAYLLADQAQTGAAFVALGISAVAAAFLRVVLGRRAAPALGAA